jgi:predicted dehydrogenase
MTTRIFLIGAGVIAQFHASAVKKLPEGETIPIFFTDPNPAAVAAFLELNPRARAFPSAQELLALPADPDDIVIVATPPALHQRFSLQALASGRNVLCEKPMAMNEQETSAMLAAAKAAGRLLGCCSCRFLGIETTDTARAIIRARQLGPLYHASMVNRERRSRPGNEFQSATTFFLDKSKNGGGTLMNMGPYDFSMLNYVLEPQRVEVLNAWTTNPTTALKLPPSVVFDVENHAGASLRYHLADGSRLDLTYERSSCTHGAERSLLEIEGLDGALQWDWDGGPGKEKLLFSHDQDGAVVDENRILASTTDLTIHERPLIYFYRHIHGQSAPIAVDEQAVFNFSIVLAIYRCAETGLPQTLTLPEKI